MNDHLGIIIFAVGSNFRINTMTTKYSFKIMIVQNYHATRVNCFNAKKYSLPAESHVMKVYCGHLLRCRNHNESLTARNQCAVVLSVCCAAALTMWPSRTARLLA